MHISALTASAAEAARDRQQGDGRANARGFPTPELNGSRGSHRRASDATSTGRKAVRILYAAQVGVAPPTFALFTNVATDLHFSYERLLKNRIRETFGFSGTPIRLQMRKRQTPGASGSLL